MTTWLQAEVEQVAATRKGCALALFDVLDELFHRRPPAGHALIDSPPVPAGREVPAHRANAGRVGLTAATLQRYAEQAGAADPVEAGCKLQILMTGAIVSASRGDEEAARRARVLAERLLDTKR